MTKRTYGQHGGVAHAAGILGERWALLIVRDLLVGPQRFTDLRRGLVRIPSNVLTSRLRELQTAGVIERTTLPMPDPAVVYRLTAYGRQLDGVVRSLGRWGAQTLGEPAPDDVMSRSALTLALQAAFDATVVRESSVTFEIHTAGVIMYARIAGGELDIRDDAPGDVDLVVVVEPAFLSLMSGTSTIAAAIESGIVAVRGRDAMVTVFAAAFGLELGALVRSGRRTSEARLRSAPDAEHRIGDREAEVGSGVREQD